MQHEFKLKRAKNTEEIVSYIITRWSKWNIDLSRPQNKHLRTHGWKRVKIIKAENFNLSKLKKELSPGEYQIQIKVRRQTGNQRFGPVVERFSI